MLASGCRRTRGSRLQWSVLTALEDRTSARGLDRGMVSNIMLQVTCSLKYEQISSSSPGGTRFRAIWHLETTHQTQKDYTCTEHTLRALDSNTRLICSVGTAVRVTLDGTKLGQPWKGLAGGLKSSKAQEVTRFPQ